MMCAGITMYSPLVRNGCGPGKSVGIVGVGGLGHFGILFAKALGADRVVALSRKADKRADALALGADLYISTDDATEDADWNKTHRRSLDLVVSTINSPNMPINKYLELLKVGGCLIQVGLPDGGELPSVNAFTLSKNNLKMGGSIVGSPREIEEMLQLAAEKQVKPWVTVRPMAEANAAVLDQAAGNARYRYVLKASIDEPRL